MATLAYLDCFSGISGDMFLGALLDAGLPEEVLHKTLARLPIRGWQLRVEQVHRSGIAARWVRIQCERQHNHRHLADIETIIVQAGFDRPMEKRVLNVFRRLARAEARVHGTDEHEVHFHEVGALDCLIDVVGAVAGLHWFGVDKLVCSPLPLPTGWIDCSHGELPLPAPAVCALLEDAAVYGIALDQELVTPTGAALARELSSSFGPLPAMTIQRTGYGAGTRERKDGRPNLLRLILGRTHRPAEVQEVEVIETHVDDMNPEIWPHVCQRLMDLQALDVSLVPIQMKKGRPGVLLRVLCDPAHGLALKQCILSETTAIGVRSHTAERMTLPRRRVVLQTPWGAMEAKEILTPEGPVVMPEYEACLSVARQHHLSLGHVYRTVTSLAENKEARER